MQTASEDHFPSLRGPNGSSFSQPGVEVILAELPLLLPLHRLELHLQLIHWALSPTIALWLSAPVDCVYV